MVTTYLTLAAAIFLVMVIYSPIRRWELIIGLLLLVGITVLGTYHVVAAIGCLAPGY